MEPMINQWPDFLFSLILLAMLFVPNRGFFALATQEYQSIDLPDDLRSAIIDNCKRFGQLCGQNDVETHNHTFWLL